MGQYHMPVCVDTMEQINPHRFGDGLKLMEFGCSGSGTMAALGLLLGGEGRWAGKRIVIVGDYAEPDDVRSIPNVDRLYASKADALEYPDDYPLSPSEYPDDISEEVGGLMVKEGFWASLPSGAYRPAPLPDPPREPSGVEAFIANLDKKEALSPGTFGDDPRWDSFIADYGGGVMTALAVLLSCSNGRGGGDARGPLGDLFAGRWAGDRIGILPHIVPVGGENFTDISLAVREAMVASNEGTYEDNDDGTVTRTSRW